MSRKFSTSIAGMQTYEAGVVQNIVTLKMSRSCQGSFFIKCNTTGCLKSVFIFQFVGGWGGKHFVGEGKVVCTCVRVM